LSNSERFQIGDSVEILQPDYLTGKIGIVYGQEELIDGQFTGRWLIQIPSENTLVSLNPDEFRLIRSSEDRL
jgi:hypothetical protein